MSMRVTYAMYYVEYLLRVVGFIFDFEKCKFRQLCLRICAAGHSWFNKFCGDDSSRSPTLSLEA